MKKKEPGSSDRDREDLPSLDELIEDITVDAHGDDEKLCVFQQAMADHIAVPCDAHVIGEPVSVIEFQYDGNERRGLTARFRREDGSEHVIPASEVVFPSRTEEARYLAAYRHWLGIGPFPSDAGSTMRGKRRHKATEADLDLSGPVDLVVLSVLKKAARCRVLGSERVITLRAGDLWRAIPGEVVTVTPRKQWMYGGHPFLSGKILSTRLEVSVLGLVPLELEDKGVWEPREHYWGDEGEPIEEWAKPIIAHGPRRVFEMEPLLLGSDLDDPWADPISESIDLRDAGDSEQAHRILMKLCEADLRCLDAHAHLGNFAFEVLPEEAIRHYEAGFRIGELSLGDSFDGLLPWGHLGNRPFLRCMHGFALCLWRLGRFEEAERVLDRMLWLNPSDNQGARFLIEEVRAREAWEGRGREA